MVRFFLSWDDFFPSYSSSFGWVLWLFVYTYLLLNTIAVNEG